MIFLCFSGKDRLNVVKSILFHLQKYGMEVWYDNYEHVLGDNKDNNYIRGIHKSKYAVVVYSPYFPNSPGAKEELIEIKKQFDNRLIHVFPIFYNINAEDIPVEDSWLCHLIYNEVNDETGTLLSCNQVVCKFYSDIVQNCAIPTLWEIKQNSIDANLWIGKMVNTYFKIVPESIDSRLTILYCIYLYLESEVPLPMYIAKTADYIFANTRLHLEYNFKEIILMEQVICIALHYYFNCMNP